ncbi:hypothetical protein BC828DRAFT_405288 [Blastocladiella britannica]|nr:hypothetical protein BC828DRAFT_405288 [Blastocladiella britannica]
MSDRILKQQLAGLIKRASSPAAAAAKAKKSAKSLPPSVRTGIGKAKNRVKAAHRGDRADHGLATNHAAAVAGTATFRRSNAAGFLNKTTGEWVAVSDEGLLGTFDVDTAREREDRAKANAAYFQLGSLADARVLSKKSKLHAYRKKEGSAKAQVIAALANAQKTKRIDRKNKTKAVMRETAFGRKKLTFVKSGAAAAHNPDDDEDMWDE